MIDFATILLPFIYLCATRKIINVWGRSSIWCFFIRLSRVLVTRCVRHHASSLFCCCCSLCQQFLLCFCHTFERTKNCRLKHLKWCSIFEYSRIVDVYHIWISHSWKIEQDKQFLFIVDNNNNNKKKTHEISMLPQSASVAHNYGNSSLLLSLSTPLYFYVFLFSTDFYDHFAITLWRCWLLLLLLLLLKYSCSFIAICLSYRFYVNRKPRNNKRTNIASYEKTIWIYVYLFCYAYSIEA